MKNILCATTGIVLAMAVAGAVAPAFADVDAVATINKSKDIQVFETITVTKDVRIFVGSAFTLDAAAEAQALANVSNVGNVVNGTDPSRPTADDEVRGEDEEYGIHLSATLEGSANNNTGVWGVNQDAGNMANQANIVSISGLSDDGIGDGAFADAQAHVDQANLNNRAIEFEVLRDLDGRPVVLSDDLDPDTFALNKSAVINNSINTNTGVMNVNQNVGNMNNQTNAVAAAVGLGAVVALSDADLGQETSGNFVNEFETVKRSTISNSINGNSGIVNVNQSTGNMNNQGNVVSLSAITSGAILTD